MQKRDNHTKKRAKPIREYPPNITKEFRQGFRAGLNTLHASGRKWEQICKDVGVSLTELDRYRKDQKTPPQPAFFFLAGALRCSLAELLMMGQEDEI